MTNTITKLGTLALLMTIFAATSNAGMAEQRECTRAEAEHNKRFVAELGCGNGPNRRPCTQQQWYSNCTMPKNPA